MRRPTAWPGPLKRALTLLAGTAIGVAALISVFVSSGGLDEVREALQRVTAAWTLAAVVAMLAGYLLLGFHLRRLTHGRARARAPH
jgi:predicted lysophospholipase L1 biosynthesis ABC-type transport system permease subunit